MVLQLLRGVLVLLCEVQGARNVLSVNLARVARVAVHLVPLLLQQLLFLLSLNYQLVDLQVFQTQDLGQRLYLKLTFLLLGQQCLDVVFGLVELSLLLCNCKLLRFKFALKLFVSCTAHDVVSRPRRLGFNLARRWRC